MRPLLDPLSRVLTTIPNRMNINLLDLSTFALNQLPVLLASSSAKFWYLAPLIAVISLVYGGTRHETLSQILAHSIRSAVWLIVFLFLIFTVIWLSGFGTASDLFNFWEIQWILAVMAWTFGAMWIAGTAFQHNLASGLGCVLSGGIYALVMGCQFRKQLMFPWILMLASAFWGTLAFWLSR